MFNKKKRLYIEDILPNAPVAGYYLLSSKLIDNEMLHQVLIDIHSLNFKLYTTPKSFEDIFSYIFSSAFAIYKERYAVGYFGGKLMYLESSGWKAMPCTQDTFKLDNWLIS